MRTRAFALLCTAALAGGSIIATGCGGGDGTPVSTTGDGRAVYDPSSTVINLPPGPKFVIRMPAAEEGSEWRLFTAQQTGGVSLKGIENANGAGDWWFDTIGAGGGTLEFRQTPIGTEDSTESVTYEVNIK